MKESAALFGNGKALVGVLTEPEPAPEGRERPAAIFLNSGLVHRVGLNRLNVRLARSFAAKGHLSFRFDFSGIGDSVAASDQGAAPEADEALPAAGSYPKKAERWISDARDAMDFLEQTRNAGRFLLIGICSGASIAYLVAHADPRVVGVGLVNPQVQVLPSHYLRTALRHPNTWRRWLAGKAKIRNQLRLRRLLAQAPPDPESSPTSRSEHDLSTGLRSLCERGVSTLLAYSEWDPSYDHFHHVLREELGAPGFREKVRVEIVKGADHEFTLLADQKRLLQIVDRWAGTCEARWH